MNFKQATCGQCDCLDPNYVPAGSPPDAGICRLDPPTPVSAYGSEYRVVRSTNPACSRIIPIKQVLQIEDHSTPELGLEVVAEVMQVEFPKLDDEQDLAGEFHAISRYKERIAEAESLREYGLRRVLEDILIVEEEHARDLLTVLGR